ncbi:hypothetical protein VSR34_29400 [Paraburkholderia sp. JHI2823]|uniref:hypothetical protein n=1 Tax=Paraburkholderia TaxID=1822464 RepID=UPI001EE2292D|nr:hypothetical protein [Paraburkholderia mimosarum]
MVGFAMAAGFVAALAAGMGVAASAVPIVLDAAPNRAAVKMAMETNALKRDEARERTVRRAARFWFTANLCVIMCE